MLNQKVLLFNEILKWKHKHAIYSEEYVVRFWIKRGEYYKQEKISYFTENKGDHFEVEERFNKDFSSATIISTIRQ